MRHDILAQLELRNPDKYIASFHRSNLRYFVRACQGYELHALLVAALRHYQGGNIIVYAPTISRVEETVDFLENQGITALPYHAKMQNEDRRRNQEMWMSDEVRVLVGTIAFGLGINKATVRAVIHTALPKSIEQYYQEAGRAGRDGNPADCVLLWQAKDAGLLGYFANQILDSAERDRAWQRYHVIRGFVESHECRHRQICKHFGEKPKWESCGGCDVCAQTPAWMEPQLLPDPRKRKKFAASAAAIPVRGAARSVEPAVAALSSDDADLRDYLREWRRAKAKERNVPAYVVLHDTTLEEICRRKPKYFAELREITGIGERKAEMFGQELLDVLAHFDRGARAAAAPAKKTAPTVETLRLLEEGKSFEEIATIRGRQVSTVIHAVAQLVEEGALEFRPEWVERNKLSVIEAACAKLGAEWLKPLKESLPPEVTYDEIRLVVARVRRQAQQNEAKTT